MSARRSIRGLRHRIWTSRIEVCLVAFTKFHVPIRRSRRAASTRERLSGELSAMVTSKSVHSTDHQTEHLIEYRANVDRHPSGKLVFSAHPTREIMTALLQLHADIDARVRAIRETRLDWQCGKGCDACCRQLANVPELTATEWDLLQQGLTTLAMERLQEISLKMSALAIHAGGPVVCPLLDEATGACPVYVQRPVACRSYGFYVQRDLGLYCHAIEARVADGTLMDVVWGNHDAIDNRLTDLGEVRSLPSWFAQWVAVR